MFIALTCSGLRYRDLWCHQSAGLGNPALFGVRECMFSQEVQL